MREGTPEAVVEPALLDEVIGRAADLRCDEPAEPGAAALATEVLLEELLATRGTPARELPPEDIPAALDEMMP